MTIVLALVSYTIASAQSATIITGNVSDSTKQGIGAVSVTIKGGTAGTYTDNTGNFRLSTVQKPPFVVVFTSVGFGTKEVSVNSATDVLNVTLEVSYQIGNEIVVAASRTPERILESPVTIERIGNIAIRNTAAASYYDMLANLKGVDLTTSSATFKTPSTRGFNGSGNLRFNQLTDGMDNQAPGLNFAVGNILGPTELEVESMELLPGASSALYGSGGQNGTLLINSKDPFKYQGLSFQIKQGVSHVDKAQRSVAPYYDWSVRYAKKITDKLAFRIGAQYVKGSDWQANDMQNVTRNSVNTTLKSGNRLTDPNYDGVNVFGDEVSATMQSIAQAAVATGTQGFVTAALGLTSPATAAQIQAFTSTPTGQAALNGFLSTNANTRPFYLGLQNNIFGQQSVSRTGYSEKDLVDYNSYNLKLNGGLHYKITNNIEASLIAYFAMGTTVYTGSDRYSIKNLKIGQYKAEIKGKNFFVRGYTTQENSGDSYTATTAAIAINRAWKSDNDWFGQYVGNYAGARLTGINDGQAHIVARTVAETGRLLPGTPGYIAAFNKAISIPVGATDANKNPLNGAKFADKTDLYQVEGQYNFSSIFKVVDVIAGASYRKFVLNSKGTIFADTTGTIGINEYGAYLQLQKKFINDKLKITAGGRFDKNENFDGRFTPRASIVYEVVKDNNVRISYQQGYRFPSTQDQYINLQTPGAKLIGGLPQFFTAYQFNTAPAYTAASVANYRANPNATTAAALKQATFTGLKPETVESFEVGYKGLAIGKRLYFDAYGYYSKYKNFIGRQAVARGKSRVDANKLTELASPFTSDNYSFVTNTEEPVKAFGYGIGFEYRAYKSYNLVVNAYSDELKDVPADIVSQFNTPKYRFNVGVNNADVYKGLGFNVMYRWQDKVYWEGTFGTGEIPKYGYVDAMISYKVPKTKNLIKLGASNLWNNYYRSAFGNPQIGGLYYISFGFNVF